VAWDRANDSGLRPDHLTRHLWETAEELFESMGKYGLKPDVWTYHEMIRARYAGGALRAVRTTASS
jgi:hypothetical protein